jgi:ABC-type lipoprotein release transport system permease subunit
MKDVDSSASPRWVGLTAFALRAIWRRRAKSVALGVGLMLAVALVAAVLFLADALLAESDRARAAMPDVTVQRLVGGRPTVLSEADLAKLGGIPSVHSVTPRVWGYLFVPALQGNVTVVGVGPAEDVLSVAHGSLAAGRDIERGRHEMVAGAGLARFLGLALDDQLGLPSANPDAPPLKLVGTFASAVELYTSDVVLCDADDARALLGMGGGQATDFAIAVVNPNETHVIARTVLARLPGTRVIERDLLGRVYRLAYGRRAGLVLAATFPAILALFVLGWDRASGVGPDEVREIAIQKAVGFSTQDVLWCKFGESLLLGLLATAAGLALAYAWVFWLGAPGLRGAIAGWSVLYPEGPITPMVDGGQLLSLTLSVVAPFVALSIVPAWRAATRDPMTAMRGG